MIQNVKTDPDGGFTACKFVFLSNDVQFWDIPSIKDKFLTWKVSGTWKILEKQWKNILNYVLFAVFFNLAWSPAKNL